jgi:hypothetical protein
MLKVHTIDESLDRLAALEPNWDAQGARAIDPVIVEAARRFVHHLSADLIGTPAVVPMAKGNLQFEWHEGSRSLELEIESRDTIHFLQWDPDQGVEEEGFFACDDTVRAISLIRWFMRGGANG